MRPEPRPDWLWPGTAQDPAELEREMRSFVESLDRRNTRPMGRHGECEHEAAARAAAAEDSYEGTALTSEYFAEGATCEIFVTNSGEYGEIGNLIARTLRQEPRLASALISDQAAATPSMRELCPGFAQAGREARINIMVWIMAAISWDEQKCGAVRDNPNDPEATGLFQMNRTRADRYWRGPHCAVPSVVERQANTLCAMEVLRGQFEGLYGEPRGLYPVSYFKKLKAFYLDRRARAGEQALETEILRRARTHPLCAQSGGS